MSNIEQLTRIWEDQREIKNLLGKYVNSLLMNWEERIFASFWSAREDVTLAFNDGVYRGSAAVRGYYEACSARNELVRKCMVARFPEKFADRTEEETKGVGPFKVKAAATPIIEVAGDGETAKGLWSCLGTHNDVESCGPIAHWTMGYFAVDFVREADGWKIWHLQYVNDIDCICGQSWGEKQVLPPEEEAFLPLRDFRYPPYTETKALRTLYSPERPLERAPRIPEAYKTFDETFSYGA